MPSTTRTFLALTLPPPIDDAIGRLQERLAPDVPGGRMVARESLHVTLAFLGDVAERELERLHTAVAEAVAPFGPFSLEVRGIGAFPGPARSRVLWAGLGGSEIGRIAPLQQAVVRAARAAGCPPADDRFSPHITLARFKPGRGPAPNLTALVARHEAWSAGTFEVTRVVAFASVLTPHGPAYTPLASAHLAGADAP